jgi:hypothetical protein
MYLNGIPQNFGQAQYQRPQELLNKPAFGYNQGISGLQINSPAPFRPAPQLGNLNPQKSETQIGAFLQPPAQPAPQPGSYNTQGYSTTASTTGIGTKPLSPIQPLQRPMAGQAMARGGVVQKTLDKGGVVSSGIAALRGQHPNPRKALNDYDEMFGREATAELMRAYADGGVVSGPGSGVADLVPGSIDGREDVRIASGEYVIPAWAVATLGDGSTEAGAKVLDAMVARLREEGSELIKGSEPINPSEFLPV